MLPRFAMFVLTCLIALSPPLARGQDLAQTLVGVWNLVSLETKEVQSGKVSRPMGDQVTGTFVFTKGGTSLEWYSVGIEKLQKVPMQPKLRGWLCLIRLSPITAPTAQRGTS